MLSVRVAVLLVLLVGAVAVTPLPQHAVAAHSTSLFSRRGVAARRTEGQSCKHTACDADLFCSTVDQRCKRKRGLHQSCRTNDGCAEPFSCLNFQCQALPTTSEDAVLLSPPPPPPPQDNHAPSPSGSPEHKVHLGPKDNGNGPAPPQPPPPQHVELPHKPSPSGSPSDQVNLSPKKPDGPSQPPKPQHDVQQPRKPSPSGSPADQVHLHPAPAPPMQAPHPEPPQPSPNGPPSDAVHPPSQPPKPQQPAAAHP